MTTVLRVSGWLLMIALVVVAAVAEVTWMAERVSAHRALRALNQPAHTPGKIINLPLTGLK